jgi:hypothetical protein
MFHPHTSWFTAQKGWVWATNMETIQSKISPPTAWKNCRLFYDVQAAWKKWTGECQHAIDAFGCFFSKHIGGWLVVGSSCVFFCLTSIDCWLGSCAYSSDLAFLDTRWQAGISPKMLDEKDLWTVQRFSAQITTNILRQRSKKKVNMNLFKILRSHRFHPAISTKGTSTG